MEASAPNSNSTPGLAQWRLREVQSRGHQLQSGLLTVNAAGGNGLDSCNIANALTDIGLLTISRQGSSENRHLGSLVTGFQDSDFGTASQLKWGVYPE